MKGLTRSRAFPGLYVGHYGVILVDPPWSFKSYSGPTLPHRTEDKPYEVMSLDALKAMPVVGLAKRDCCLFLWTFGAHMEQAMEVGRAWGFVYKTKAFEWIKTTKDGNPKMGMGYWTRQESESVLLFTRGSPQVLDHGVRSTIWAPTKGHSRKPDESFVRIAKLTTGPYAELFATKYRFGWDGWGDDYL